MIAGHFSAYLNISAPRNWQQMTSHEEQATGVIKLFGNRQSVTSASPFIVRKEALGVFTVKFRNVFFCSINEFEESKNSAKLSFFLPVTQH